LQQGALKLIVQSYDQLKGEQSRKTAVWTLSNLCKGSPAPELEQVQECVPIFYSVIQNEDGEEILVDATLGLCYVSVLTDDSPIMIPMGIVTIILKHLE